jgi:hypothetical protein
MRGERSGMALIFDAMAFLTIITIVSVTLLQAFTVDHEGQGMDEHVTDIHKAVMDSTFENDAATALTVQDMIVLSLMSNDVIRTEEVREQIDDLLNSYLAPTYRYHWAVEYQGVSFEVGDPRILDERATIYCSSIESFDARGDRMVMILSVVI